MLYQPLDGNLMNYDWMIFDQLNSKPKLVHVAMGGFSKAKQTNSNKTDLWQICWNTDIVVHISIIIEVVLFVEGKELDLCTKPK